MKSVEKHPNQGMHLDLSYSLRKKRPSDSALHEKMEKKLHKTLIGEDRSKDVEDKQMKLTKKASLEDYLNVTQLKREDTEAYLRYLTKFHDHHEAQENPKFPVKFAHTRADAPIDMEKVAFLGGLARGVGSAVGKGSAAAGRIVGGGARMAGSAVNRASTAKSSLGQWAANKRQAVGGMGSKLRGAYNEGRHGSVMGSPAQFEAATLKNNPNLAGTRPQAQRTYGPGAPARQAPQKPILERASDAVGGKVGPTWDKAKSSAKSNLNYAKSRYSQLSPNAKTGVKVGAGLAAAYGGYKAGKAVHNRFQENRAQREYGDY